MFYVACPMKTILSVNYTGPERRVEWVSDVLWHGESEGDDPEVLAHPHQLPLVKLLPRVAVLQELVVPEVIWLLSGQL